MDYQSNADHYAGPNRGATKCGKAGAGAGVAVYGNAAAVWPGSVFSGKLAVIVERIALDGKRPNEGSTACSLRDVTRPSAWRLWENQLSPSNVPSPDGPPSSIFIKFSPSVLVQT